jgi:hypothetical protein
MQKIYPERAVVPCRIKIDNILQPLRRDPGNKFIYRFRVRIGKKKPMAVLDILKRHRNEKV